MVDTDFVDAIARSLRERSQQTFDERVKEQATAVTTAIDDGELDNPDYGIGLELEVYAVDEDEQLARLPDSVFNAPCARELGLHNAELNTSPNTLSAAGLEAQAAALEKRYRATQGAAADEDVSIILDAMWTVPPTEGSATYLGNVDDVEGFIVANNMTHSSRYSAIDNDILQRTGGTVSVSVPGATVETPTILLESLTSSMQPHLQVPTAEAFPAYYNAAIASLGPVTALATNSPLLPLDYYRTGDMEPKTLLEETHHELRIAVFEESINGPWEKVKFPGKIGQSADVLEKLVADATCAPFLREWVEAGDRETFADQYWELSHKRGTYWRWVRAVTGGQPVGDGDERSIRIEYRPLAAQPTVEDNVQFLALVAGLLVGLNEANHPLGELEADAAKRSFYSAVKHSLEADLEWITADGERTTDSAVIYDELFSFARAGLQASGLSPAAIDRYIAPLEARWDDKRTPSRWKLETVREGLENGGSFEDSVRAMQATYNDYSRAQTPFIEWE